MPSADAPETAIGMMTPDATAARDTHSSKRGPTDDEDSGGRPNKRPRQDESQTTPALPQYRHSVHHRQTLTPQSRLGHEEAQAIILRSLGIALKTAGFDASDGKAMEAFRSRVDDYMTKFATTVSRSMLISRRTQPIPQDFGWVLARLKLSPEELIPHLKPVASVAVVIPPFPSPPPEERPKPSLASIDHSLSGKPTPPIIIPPHLPPLPGQHTYKATAVFTEQDIDPMRTREKAAEEGRLGEEALRGLLAAKAFSTRGASLRNAKSKNKTLRHAGWWDGGEDMRWETTMAALGAGRRQTGKERVELESVGPTAENVIDVDMGMREFSGIIDQEVAVPRMAMNAKDTGGIVNFELRWQRRGGDSRKHFAHASIPKEDTSMTGVE